MAQSASPQLRAHARRGFPYLCPSLDLAARHTRCLTVRPQAACAYCGALRCTAGNPVIRRESGFVAANPAHGPGTARQCQDSGPRKRHVRARRPRGRPGEWLGGPRSGALHLPGVRGRPARLRGQGRVDEGAYEKGGPVRCDVLRPPAVCVPPAVQLEPVPRTRHRGLCRPLADPVILTVRYTPPGASTIASCRRVGSWPCCSSDRPPHLARAASMSTGTVTQTRGGTGGVDV